MNTINRAMPLLLLALFSTASWAVDEAPEEEGGAPIYIEADTVVYNEATGESVYEGGVIVSKGGLTQWSDKLTVTMTEEELDKVVANGDPVRFIQKDAEGVEAMKGHAQITEYYVQTDLVVLLDKAIVHQEGNTYASDRIEYDRKNLLIKAGKANSGSQRVHVTIKPKRQAANNGNTSGQ